MKLVRKSTFETNSSSCHSLTVGTGDVYEGYTPNEDNLIVLQPQSFGWEEETYHDVESRLAYVYIYIRDWSGSRSEDFMEIYQKVVCEHTGASFVTMNDDADKNGYHEAYIDHQSVESNDLHFLFESEKMLKDFLFSHGSYITTDNDNH